MTGFVGENAFQDQELFTLRVLVRRERAAGCISNDARCAGDLVADSVEHQPIYTGLGGSHPVVVVRYDEGSFRKIRIDSHVAMIPNVALP